MRLPDMLLRLRPLKGEIAADIATRGSGGKASLPLPSGPPFVKGGLCQLYRLRISLFMFNGFKTG